MLACRAQAEKPFGASLERIGYVGKRRSVEDWINNMPHILAWRCHIMYDRITNTILDVFDAPTREYVGRFMFSLDSGAATKLLNLINYNIIPDSLLILDANLYAPPKRYTPPVPYQKYRREAVLSGDVEGASAGIQIPVEMRLKYDMRGRVKAYGDLYHYDSMELSNIDVVSIKQIQP